LLRIAAGPSDAPYQPLAAAAVDKLVASGLEEKLVCVVQL
jgi:hypothetical protein